MKRIVRKQLKEDEFVSTINRIIFFAKKRARELMAAAVVLLVGVMVVIGIRIVQAQNSKKQSQLLSEIIRIESELKENPDRILELEKLTGSGRFARVASLKLAGYWLEQGNYEKSLSYLEKFPEDRRDLIYYQAQAMKAQVFRSQEKYDDALKIYLRIEEENPEEFAEDIVLFLKAQTLEKMGDMEGAIEVYKKIQEDYPQTYFGYDAGQKVRQLEKN